jgi:hypothetical protein
VLVIEGDSVEWLSGLAPVEERCNHVDHRPSEPRQQSQRARQVGDQQMDLLFPRQHSFYSELRERLQPRENGQRETLGDEELR